MKTPRSSLSVELLEGRDMPQASPANPVTLIQNSPASQPKMVDVRVAGNNLVVTGSDRAERIQVEEMNLNGQCIKVTATTFGSTGTLKTEVYRVDLRLWTNATLGNLVYRGNGGDDNFEYIQHRQDTARLAVLANGGAGNDFLKGGTRDDILIGGKNNDTLNGNGGDDLLLGGSGKDQLSGSAWVTGPDKDWKNGTSDNNILIGGTDVDTLIGGASFDILDGGQDGVRDLLHGNGGRDFYMNDYSVKGNEIMYGSRTSNGYLPVNPAYPSWLEAAKGSFESAVVDVFLYPKNTRADRIAHVNEMFDHGKEPLVGVLVADLFEQFQGPYLGAAFAE